MTQFSSEIFISSGRAMETPILSHTCELSIIIVDLPVVLSIAAFGSGMFRKCVYAFSRVIGFVAVKLGREETSEKRKFRASNL